MIDSHAHLISADAERYPTSPLSGELEPGALDNPVTAERLLALMDEQGIERALAVQRAHIYGFNNAYVCDAAARYPERCARSAWWTRSTRRSAGRCSTGSASAARSASA